MADISTFADRFAANLSQQTQPVAEMVNARLQRIQELERIRQEHAAEHPSSAGNSTERHTRRERFIRQASQRSSIQRTPVRSQSFENASTVNNVDEDTLRFRELFESSRQNLFGPRISESSESLDGRRPSDTNLAGTRATFQTGSESGSGSSTPLGPQTLPQQNDFVSGLAEAFSNIRSSLIRSDSSGALIETRRSSSTTRETNASNIQRFHNSNTSGNSVERSSSLRESRRESRFRRRTIQGVDNNVARALEQERIQTSSSSITRSMSPLVMETTSTPTLSVNTTINQSRESTRTASSYTSSAYSSRYQRKIDLHPEDGIPMLGLEKEKEIFIDNNGKCFWLNKSHPLIRELKSTKKLPIIEMKAKLAITDGENADGYFATMEGSEEARYSKLRELVKLARMRDANFENGDNTDSARSLSLLELHQRGDYIEEVDVGIDEKYKSFSLYTEPRKRQDIESLISTKEVLPIYDGIPRSELPQEIKDRENAELESEQNQGRKTVERSTFSAFHRGFRTQTNGATTRTEQSNSAENHEQIFGESADGNSSGMFERSEAVHETSETQSDNNGNENARFEQINTQTQHAVINQENSVSNVLQRRAEARRQQYLATRGSSENGGLSLQRRAEERRQQYLAEQQTNENGSIISRTRAEDTQQRFASETQTSQNGSTLQRHSEERQQQSFTSESNSNEHGSSMRQSSVIRQSSQSSFIRHSSQSSITREPLQSPIDNSDIHDEVNLVMQRLQMMQTNANETLDTSHLDYEEMLMIQKALAENPSPPESPVAFQTEEIISVSDEDNDRNQPEEDFTSPITIESSGSNEACVDTPDSSTSKTDSTKAVVRASSDNVINPGFGSSTQTFISARQSVITHTKVVDDKEAREDNVVETVESSVNAPNRGLLVEASSSETSSSVKKNVIEARTPRYQRLPSEGIESRLPLPSIDWSPLEKSNSPLSPKRFSFEDKKSENTSSASSTTSETAASSKFTVPKTSPPTQQTGNKTSVQSELTIQIPSDNLSTSQSFQDEAGSAGAHNLANQNDSNKSDIETAKSPSSPLVKSVEGSVSGGSDTDESETITTVFEEFVQTIPYSMLHQ